MSNQNYLLPDSLHSYILATSLREPDILQRLREETAAMPMARMQISPEQGQFLQLLIGMLNATKTIEVGVFTGYSSLAVALALTENGRIVACDVSEEYTRIARRYWEQAGVAGKIDLRIGPAIETLDRLLAYGQGGTFDFAFIDADKENYDEYFERILELLRPGGIIAIDNVLWSGKVADPTVTDPETSALRALNLKLRDDPRVRVSMLPIGDGLTLALKQR